MIALILCAILGAGIPDLKKLAASERRAFDLPCNIEDDYYVPDDAEVSYLTEEAGVNDWRLDDLRAVMMARRALRVRLDQATDSSCDDVEYFYETEYTKARALLRKIRKRGTK